MRRRTLIATGGLAGAIAIATPFIITWEGWRPVGYRDVVNVATSCVGHTGPDAIVGRRYTKAECESQLARDLQRTADGIAPCITAPLPDKTLAAFVSFSFNVGVGAFCRTAAYRPPTPKNPHPVQGVAWLANHGDLRGACARLTSFVYAGRPPRVIKGLMNRRIAERKLCEEGLPR